MSLQGLDEPGLPGASVVFNHFVARVRLFMRDYPQLNRLVEGEETDDRMIAFSIYDAISEFNSTDPDIGLYGFSDFMTKNWQRPLMLGTVLMILESVGLLQTRNHLPFSDGGLNVAVSDKTPLLQNWIQLFQMKWDKFRYTKKMALNIGSLFQDPGGVSSELFVVNGYWYDEFY
jgi:hypothetical protein